MILRYRILLRKELEGGFTVIVPSYERFLELLEPL
jgi:hypothetical protein